MGPGHTEDWKIGRLEDWEIRSTHEIVSTVHMISYIYKRFDIVYV